MKHLLIRADDLGLSEGVNYGIEKAVCGGIIRTVGVMTNMPAAKHGLDLLKNVPVCFGQHTNICTGRPLTDPALIPSITDKDGNFKSSKEYRSATEDFVVLDEVILEIEAQYQMFKKLVGEEPSYFEGHAVASANFFKGLEIVAKEHNLPYFAMSMKGEPVKFRNSLVYAYMPKDFAAYEEDPFTGLQDLAANAHESKNGGEMVCDLMVCHPGYIDDDLLRLSSMTIPRVKEAAMASSERTKKWLKEQDITLVTYNDLR